jgi:hypothetical protein
MSNFIKKGACYNIYKVNKPPVYFLQSLEITESFIRRLMGIPVRQYKFCRKKSLLSQKNITISITFRIFINCLKVVLKKMYFCKQLIIVTLIY